MRAISLWQPWASALMLGAAWKHHETRHWPAPPWAIGQRIAIHAAKRWTLEEVCAQDNLVRAGFPLAGTPPLGCVLGYATLRACFPTEGLRPTKRDALAGNWARGRFAWQFVDHVLLPTPVPFRGAQGFFVVPDELFAIPTVSEAR